MFIPHSEKEVVLTQTTTCPRCGRADCKVREAFVQATRYEPMRSLGWQAFCPTCDLYFKVASDLVQASFA